MGGRWGLVSRGTRLLLDLVCQIRGVMKGCTKRKVRVPDQRHGGEGHS